MAALPEGTDLTQVLKIEKYEPDIPAELRGQMRGNFPSFLIKTDTHRVQAHPRTIEELKACEEVYMTIKYDGTSFTAYNRIEPTVDVGQERFGVCSRNIDLCESDTNTYWQMARQYELARILSGKSMAMQSEIVGPGIQKNRMGLDKVQIAVFDAFDINQFAYLGLNDLIVFCGMNKLPMVQVIYRGPMKWNTVDELIELANQQRYPNGKQAEGIIIRSCKETYSEALQGRLAIKVISPLYLLEHGS